MALTWNIETDETIEFNDFLELLKSQGKDVLHKDLDQSALAIRKLANNRHFVTDSLNRQLKNLKAFQAGNLYTPQVFLLDKQDFFFFRVCMWLPPQNRPGETLYFYDTAHDHNFSFLTAGYYGAGYRTFVYEYDKSEVVGYSREKVAMRFLEDTELPLGKVMLYREDKDIHIQLAPKDLSISINVMRYPDLDRSRRPDQYYFDLETETLLRKADRVDAGILIRLAGALASSNTVDVLTDISRTHAHRRTRLYAFEAIAQNRGNQSWEMALHDKDKLIRTIAEQKLNPSLIPMPAPVSCPAPAVAAAYSKGRPMGPRSGAPG